MSRTRKSLTFAAVTAALAAGVLTPATSASAADAPAFLGEPKEWGVVAINIDGSSPVRPLTVKDVGGGTWSYGTTLSGTTKTCYSNYIHQSKEHSATAKMADYSKKVTEVAGVWANAKVGASPGSTCYTYWATY
ncbi:lactococcin 972 family bacteriocin [Streptomyces regalis]|uniref:lactococcin 972 family bacteriocin n=1 Tax=Streptomyces regalis TaxID=68262 RepID=UPI00099F28E0|nr:lactococcin 972 family bacteriocin [Streptomyces regalis]